VEINAIDYWRDVVVEIDQLLAPLQLLGLIFRSKRDVVHRTGRHAAH
jgi:hypothetical protein